MLRFSDDDVPMQEAQVSKKVEGANTSKPAATKKEGGEGGEVGPNKPNFVYIVCIFRIANCFCKNCYNNLYNFNCTVLFYRTLQMKILWLCNIFYALEWEREKLSPWYPK